MIELQQATKARRVIYIPNHANGDRNHPDCQHGCIKRPTDDGQAAFVLYDNLDHGRMTTGDEDYTAQRTELHNLHLE